MGFCQGHRNPETSERTEVTGSAGAVPALAQLIDSGPDRPDDTIFTLLVSACFTSQRRIPRRDAVLCSGAFVAALTLAARRGINVDLVLPERSNHRLADFARHRACAISWKAGGRVSLHPRMVHAKAVLVDELALVGSADLDGRSLCLQLLDGGRVLQPAGGAGVRRLGRCPAPGVAYPYRRPGILRELMEGLLLWLAFQL